MVDVPKDDSGHDRLIQKLDSTGRLNKANRDILRALPLSLRSIGRRRDVFRDGDRPTQYGLVLAGFVCRYKMMPEGHRQIVSLHVPGDIPDLQGLYLARRDHSLATLTPAKIGFIPHAALMQAIERSPTLMMAIWRDTLIEAAVFRQWIVNVGTRSASARIAHLICELHTRLRAVGLGETDGFVLPLNQVEIGEAMGLSPVHVNRVIQNLRAKGLIASQGRFLRILDWPGLQQEGGFDATYLHLQSGA